jgi:hypothetical protein
MSTPAPLDRKGLEEKLGAELAAFVEEFRAIADRWDKATDPDEDAKLRAEMREMHKRWDALQCPYDLLEMALGEPIDS